LPAPTQKPSSAADVERGAVADPSIDAIDLAVTGTIADTALTASTATTAVVDKAKPKAKVKKQVNAAERKVQNKKR
jgi:hypothetical protein